MQQNNPPSEMAPAHKNGHKPGFILKTGAKRLFMVFSILLFTSMAVAGDSYNSRSYRKKPRTELSSKSKKGIERILQGEDAGNDKKGNLPKNALASAKADTERYRLLQEQNMAYILDEQDEDGETPDYMRQAMEAYRYTGDRNVKRFAEAVSEFQLQELRAQALEHIDDSEKFNRYMAIISGKQYAPYTSISNSGYVVNKSTGEISVGNSHTARMHDKKVRADTARTNASAASQYARTKERQERAVSGASRTASKTAASPGMTEAEYRQARARAIEINRMDLVKELDDVAHRSGFIN